MPTYEDFIDIYGETAQAWVDTENRKTETAIYQNPIFSEITTTCLNYLGNENNIILPEIDTQNRYRGFWKDERYPRGVLADISSSSYRSKNPDWRIILDIGALCAAENRGWTYESTEEASFNGKNYMLVSLSEGGSDAVEIREFNVDTLQFIDAGFRIPMAKTSAMWFTKNSILLATTLHNHSVTRSGYPRSVHLLKRNQDFSESKLILEIPESHLRVSINNYVGYDDYIVIKDEIDFYCSNNYLVSKTMPFELHRLPIPQDAEFCDIYKNLGLIQLKSNWTINEKTTFEAGSLIAFNIQRFQKKPFLREKELNFQLVYTPPSKAYIKNISVNLDSIFIELINNTFQELHIISRKKTRFISNKLPLPDYGTVSLISVKNSSQEVFITYEDFLTPTKLYSYHSRNKTLTLVKSEPNFLNPCDYQITRVEVKSADGVNVPYSMISSKHLKLDGCNPTIIHAYGGFEEALTPDFLGTKVLCLIEKGFVYVQAAIRGGSELGLDWAKAGRKEKKQNSFNDLIAVAENLIRQKVTSPPFLGIEGESNGGLLVGACAIQRPELFGAVMCEVPLLDMLNYHKLLVGHSWIAEYGDPDDPEMRTILEKYSPLHNIQKNTQYPVMFFQTSTTDDRVHPYHARMMAHKLQTLGNKVYFFEDKQGGHTCHDSLMGSVIDKARSYVFFHKELYLPALAQRSCFASQNAVRLFGPAAANRNKRQREEDVSVDLLKLA